MILLAAEKRLISFLINGCLVDSYFSAVKRSGIFFVFQGPIGSGLSSVNTSIYDTIDRKSVV